MVGQDTTKEEGAPQDEGNFKVEGTKTHILKNCDESFTEHTNSTNLPINPQLQEQLDLQRLKRKAEQSPDTVLSKKDKKRLKDQAKTLRKQEDLENKQVSIINQ